MSILFGQTLVAVYTSYNSTFYTNLKKRHELKSVVEEVLSLHFDEIELVVVLKSLHIGKYFDKIFGNIPLPQ